MSNATNTPIIHPPSIIVTGRPQPRLQALAITLGLPSKVGQQMAAAWKTVLAGKPDLVEIHMGSHAFLSYRAYLKEELGRNDSDPTAVGPGGLEATVYEMPSLKDAMVLFLTCRG